MGCLENVSAIDCKNKELTANKTIKFNDLLPEERSHFAWYIKSFQMVTAGRYINTNLD